MKSWRVHWDHQIYKALEHQYQLGLEALNQHMPEIKVDIIYRWLYLCSHNVDKRSWLPLKKQHLDLKDFVFHQNWSWLY